MALKAIQVESAKPNNDEGKDYRVADGGGLYLLARPNGRSIGSTPLETPGLLGNADNDAAMDFARNATTTSLSMRSAVEAASRARLPLRLALEWRL